VQSRDPTAESEDKRTICFHWDKDEGVHRNYGLYIFPQLSTVTYLSGGAPAAGGPKRNGPKTNEPQKGGPQKGRTKEGGTKEGGTKEGQEGSQESSGPKEGGGQAPTVVLDRRVGFDGGMALGPIGSGTACYPRVGRHLSFDGRLLHGAPVELASPGTAGAGPSPTGARVTFLVNVWLQHKPNGVKPLDETIVSLMGKDKVDLQLPPLSGECLRQEETLIFPPFPQGAPEVRAKKETNGGDATRLVFPLSDAGQAHALVLEVENFRASREAATASGAVRLGLEGNEGAAGAQESEKNSTLLRAWIEISEEPRERQHEDPEQCAGPDDGGSSTQKRKREGAC